MGSPVSQLISFQYLQIILQVMLTMVMFHHLGMSLDKLKRTL